MANHDEPMDIDSLECDFDNKENTYHNNVVPCTEKGYEELDVSELNMKLRYSITPAASPMSKSFTNYTRNLEADDSLNYSVNESNLTHSLNSNMTRNENVVKSLKALPLQSLPTDQADRTTVLRQSESLGLSQDPNITVTVSGANDDENISLPSSSSSALHTPEATTPTKDPEKNENDSPIMRGLKSVLNIFRSSQSPIPPADNDVSTNHISPKPEEPSEKVMSASTPIAAHRSKESNGSKRNSPYKESLTFNEDLEKELQWKDETTIFFGQEKIPVHKLFLTKPSESLPKNEPGSQQNQNLNKTVEYMDISFNDTIGDRTLTETLPKHDTVESDSEFVDCETTFTKDDKQEKSNVSKDVKCSESGTEKFNEMITNDTHVISTSITEKSLEEKKTLNDTTFTTTEVQDLQSKTTLENIVQVQQATEQMTEEKRIKGEDTVTNANNISETFNDKSIIDSVAQIPQTIVEYKPEQNKLEANTFTNVIEDLHDDLENKDQLSQAIIEPKPAENITQDDGTVTKMIELKETLQEKAIVESLALVQQAIVEPVERKIQESDELFTKNTQINDSALKEKIENECQVSLDKTEIISQNDLLQTTKEDNLNDRNETITIDENITNNEILNKNHKLDLTQDISMDYDYAYTNNTTISLGALENNETENIINEEINTTTNSGDKDETEQEIDPPNTVDNHKVSDVIKMEEKPEQPIESILAQLNTTETMNTPEEKVEVNTNEFLQLENNVDNEMNSIGKQELAELKDIESSPVCPSNEEINNVCVTPENYIPIKIPGAPRFRPSEIPLPDDDDELPMPHFPELDIIDDIHTVTSEAMALVDNLFNERAAYFMSQSELNNISEMNTPGISSAVNVEVEDNKFNINTTRASKDRDDDNTNDQILPNNIEENPLDVIETAQTSQMLPDLLNQTVTVALENSSNDNISQIVTATNEIANNADNLTKHDTSNQDQQISNEKETKLDTKSPENNSQENEENKIIGNNHEEQMNVTYNENLDKNREISEVTLYSDNIMKTIEDDQTKNVNEPPIDNFQKEDKEIISILNNTLTSEETMIKQEPPVDSAIALELSIDPKIELNDKGLDSPLILNKTQDVDSVIGLTKTVEKGVNEGEVDSQKGRNNPEGEMKEELITSENNSPYVSVSADLDKVSQEMEIDLEPVQNINRSNSPPISSKGYNFNFDEMDDPFATKTAIRMSPTPETPNPSENLISDDKKADDLPKKVNQNRRKSHADRRRSHNKKINKASESPKILRDKTFDVSNDDVIDAAPSSAMNTTEIIEKVLTKEDEKLNQTHKLDTTVEIQNHKATIPETLPESEKIETSSEACASTSSFKSRNVFNIPEIDDMSFNPFATKSKVCQSPPTVVDDNPFATRSKIRSSPDSSLVVQQENDISNAKQVSSAHVEEKDYEHKMETEAMEKDASPNTSNSTITSKSTEINTTAKEIHTEDEDTIEGPFLEIEDDDDANVTIEDKKRDFRNKITRNLTENEENAEGELFIDAEAFEFLLNQNTNIVADSGKESLFLKFDPLFAKRMSTDNVAAALNSIRKQTPQTGLGPVQANSTFNAGPSNLNITLETDYSAVEGPSEDLNITVTKPMMVVTPAVNLVPTRKSITPTRPNRRSITFTSPAMAVIDRLLSLSGNTSVIEQEPTQVSPERNDAGLALTQLREMLAEKEIHVYNLRAESKDLKERLTTLESQMTVLETEGQQRLQKINDLNDKLTEKTKINKSMAAVVEEYERTIASLIADTEQDKKRHAEERIALINERDEQTAHLASMEVSFNDLHSKYEKSKQVILSYKANEEKYKSSLKEMEENVTKMQKNYELLKQHATSKLNHANDELQKLNRAHEAEVVKLNAMIKRKELHITSLEETLTQKTKANEELTAICDELINKVG